MVLMKIGSCVIIGNVGLLDKLNQTSHKKIHLKSSWPFDDTIMESSIIVSWNQIRPSWQRPVYIIWNWCILVNIIKCPILLQSNTGPNASKATRLKNCLTLPIHRAYTNYYFFQALDAYTCQQVYINTDQKENYFRKSVYWFL